MMLRIVVVLIVTISCPTSWCQSAVTHSTSSQFDAATNAVVVRRDHVWEVAHGITLPIRELAEQYKPNWSPHVEEERDLPSEPAREPILQTDGALQTKTLPQGLTANVGLSFDGLSTDGPTPPDPNGAVGTTQYVEVVNVQYAVFDKSNGAIMAGPFPTSQLWAGLSGSECQTEDDGDATVAFDKQAQRWVIQQFALGTNDDGPYYDCIAVSTTSDATGTWNAYIFGFNFGSSYLADYPKLGTWPSSYGSLPEGVYLLSFNIYNGYGGSYNGPDACFVDRGAMLNGAPATQNECLGISSAVNPLLPADIDGYASPSTMPPAGEPGFFMTFDPNGAALDIFKFYPCYPDCSSFSASSFPAPAFTPYWAIAAHGTNCTFLGKTRNGPGDCDIPEASGDGTYLDSLSTLPMYRLVYRNFGSHESLVFNHTVLAYFDQVNEVAGVRWYEVQNPNGAPFVAQAGTWAPSGYEWRWMGSTAMDQVGDQALGYSISLGQINGSPAPQIAIAGRTPSDPQNTMEAEVVVVQSMGYQNGGDTRWGDYSSMQLDPVDDCTFWYTQEYLPNPVYGPVIWGTYIVTFRFPNCVATSSNALASSNSASAFGQSVTFTAAVTTNGPDTPTGTVTFNDSSMTLGTGTLNSSGVATYTTSTLSVGQHSITAVYPGDANNAGSNSAVLIQTVSDFALSSAPTTASVAPGTSASFSLTVAPQGSFGSLISFACSGLPALAGCTFSPTTITPNANSATIQLSISTTAPTALLAPPESDRRLSPLFALLFALPAMLFSTPKLRRSKREKLLSYILFCLLSVCCLFQTACGGGHSGGGSGGGVSSGTPAGTYTITVTGTAGSTQHTTTVTLTVQ